MPRDNNHFAIRQFLADLANDGQAIHAVHFEIGQNNVRFVSFDDLCAAMPTGGDEALVAHPLQALGHDIRVVGFIIDNQQLQTFAKVF